jgi:hypothetical protein
MTRAHHRHGVVRVGRIMVIAACVMLLVENGLLFREGASPEHPVEGLKVIAVLSLLWMFTGAWAMCFRKVWGRVLTLTILYLCSAGYFLAVIITVTSGSGVFVGRLRPIVIATLVYIYLSLVLTHSRHVRRLTSRTWE